MEIMGAFDQTVAEPRRQGVLETCKVLECGLVPEVQRRRTALVAVATLRLFEQCPEESFISQQSVLIEIVVV